MEAPHIIGSVVGGILALRVGEKIIFDWLKGNRNGNGKQSNGEYRKVEFCNLQHKELEKSVDEIKETHKELFKKIDDIWCYIIKEKGGRP